MKLNELCRDFEYELLQGDSSVQIEDIRYDFRGVSEGDIFVCISGALTDGHKYIGGATDKGAAAVMLEKEEYAEEIPENITVIKVESSRVAMARMSAAYFGYPAQKLTTIGITGTKGKTTTAHMVKRILEADGRKTGMIGTIGIVTGNREYKTANTTPESYELHKAMAEMVDTGCKCAVMEVSSQAIKLDRTAGIMFDMGIYLNLSEDHIGPGEHADFREYKDCKSRLFRQCRTGIINIDDQYGDEIAEYADCRVVTTGNRGDADLHICDSAICRTTDMLGMKFKAEWRPGNTGYHELAVNVPGEFSVHNAAAAIAAALQADVSWDKIKEALMDIHVKGRTELISIPGGAHVIIDFAHNRASMENILTSMRKYSDGRLICVFGAGGNRSRERRYGMGEAAGKLADMCILTEDNPRNEKMSDINADIVAGLLRSDNRNYIEVENRKEAIYRGIKEARPGDLVIIMGKGHETYIEKNGVKEYYSEHEAVNEAVARIQAEN
ncbi:MAG: UDP-N-acetylmuramoyl-L-alanyl-D-glutamate--2,6-diaminopimelate ligase [Lentihominibacter sp.]